MSTFFMANLFLNTGVYCYKRVRSWKSRYDVFSYSKVFFPINIDNEHWVCIVWIVESSTLIFNDSMLKYGHRSLDVIRSWIFDEIIDKRSSVHLSFERFISVIFLSVSVLMIVIFCVETL